VRVAALYDIHGNLPALEVVLADVDRLGADVIVVGGDVAAGPMPAGTMQALHGLGERARWIRGNADREPVPAGDWLATHLSEGERAFLRHLPERVSLDVNGLGPVAFCHATPRSDEEIVTSATPEELLGAAFADVEERVVVCGHTHVQYDRPAGRTRVVNAGSVGCPYEDEPGAYWALLGPDVDLRRTPYDQEEAKERFRAAGFVDELPSARRAEAIAYFEQLAGR
jgi:putative phosphoesterase